mgnify:CR=1 FL=1
MLDTSASVEFHPSSQGRLITLDAPYDLPATLPMDGIAGIQLKRPQNEELVDRIQHLSEANLAAFRMIRNSFANSVLQPAPKEGPRQPPSISSLADKSLATLLEHEATELAQIFCNITGAPNARIWWPQQRAGEFHIDGGRNNVPTARSWRMTCALSGRQSVWHTFRYKPGDDIETRQGGFMTFPLIPEAQQGRPNIDYFEAEGPLIFRTNSLGSGLFHKTPTDDDGLRTERAQLQRLMVTIDARAPKDGPCSVAGLCPAPCQ